MHLGLHPLVMPVCLPVLALFCAVVRPKPCNSQSTINATTINNQCNQSLSCGPGVKVKVGPVQGSVIPIPYATRALSHKHEDTPATSPEAEAQLKAAEEER